MKRIPFTILPLSIQNRIARLLMGFSQFFVKFIPGLKYDLEKTDLELKAEEYLAHAIVTSAILGTVFTIFPFYALSLRNTPALTAGAYALGIGAFVSILFIILLVQYPKILGGKKAEMIDRQLVFALKDLAIQIGSGVPTYNAMVNVAEAGYGEVSNQFGTIAKLVNSGTSMNIALDKASQTTKSEYFRRTMWQMVNAIKAGASLKYSIESIIADITNEQKNALLEYSKELNLWVLGYLLVAIAIPTIGFVMLMVLSSFAGGGVKPETFIVLIAITFIAQYILISFIKSRRPAVSF